MANAIEALLDQAISSTGDYGVSLRMLQEYRPGATWADLKQLPLDEARRVYEYCFVDAPGFNRVDDEALRYLLVESGMQHGVDRAVQWLQRAAGAKPDGVLGPRTLSRVQALGPETVFRGVVAERLQYYSRVVADNADYCVFIPDWLRRVAVILRGERTG